MILFSTLTQLNVFLFMVYFGLLSGVFYEVIYFLRKTLHFKVFEILGDIVFVSSSALLFVFAINYSNFGQLRLFLFVGFVLGFVLERISIGFLVAKFLEFIYNKVVLKIFNALKGLRRKTRGRKKVKNNR